MGTPEKHVGFKSEAEIHFISANPSEISMSSNRSDDGIVSQEIITSDASMASQDSSVVSDPPISSDQGYIGSNEDPTPSIHSPSEIEAQGDLTTHRMGNIPPNAEIIRAQSFIGTVLFTKRCRLR